jgi:hypothetical protein
MVSWIYRLITFLYQGSRISYEDHALPACRSYGRPPLYWSAQIDTGKDDIADQLTGFGLVDPSEY